MLQLTKLQVLDVVTTLTSSQTLVNGSGPAVSESDPGPIAISRHNSPLPSQEKSPTYCWDGDLNPRQRFGLGLTTTSSFALLTYFFMQQLKNWKDAKIRNHQRDMKRGTYDTWIRLFGTVSRTGYDTDSPGIRTQNESIRPGAWTVFGDGKFEFGDGLGMCKPTYPSSLLKFQRPKFRKHSRVSFSKSQNSL